MNNRYAANARVQEILTELNTKAVSPGRLKQLETDLERIETAEKTYRKALGYSGAAEPNPYGNGPDSPHGAGIQKWQLPEGQGSNIAQLKHHAPTPMDMDMEQVKSLYGAGRNKMSFSTVIGKGSEHNKSFTDSIYTKTAVGEGASGSLIPPILLPNAFSLRLEPTRISEYFPVVESEGQTVSWISHTSSTVPASQLAVSENTQKLDIGPVLESHQTEYTVVAGLAYVSKQLFTDFEDVASFMPMELSKYIVLAENYQLLQGNGTAPNQTGIFNTSGTLTRTYSPGADGTIIDVVLDAVNDIRVGGSYASADLILLHPTDWLTMRKLKTSFGSYVLDPNDPNSLGGIDNIFGIRVVTSTQVPQGSAAVIDSKIAINIFRRWGLEIMANPYSDTAYAQNQIAYRAETRFGLGIIYGQSLCLLDNLNGE